MLCALQFVLGKLEALIQLWAVCAQVSDAQEAGVKSVSNSSFCTQKAKPGMFYPNCGIFLKAILSIVV